MPDKPLPPVTGSANQTLEGVTQVAHGTIEPLSDFIDRLRRGGDGGHVRLIAAQFDSALEDILCAHLPKLTARKRKELVERGPLSDFATRIDIVYAMGAIDEPMRQDLNTLRVIRNKFAHPNEHLHLDLKEVRELMHGFKGYDATMGGLAFFKKKTDEMWILLTLPRRD
jgi:mannitol repressor